MGCLADIGTGLENPVDKFQSFQSAGSNAEKSFKDRESIWESLMPILDCNLHSNS
jgi:hypothetical protein